MCEARGSVGMVEGGRGVPLFSAFAAAAHNAATTITAFAPTTITVPRPAGAAVRSRRCTVAMRRAGAGVKAPTSRGRAAIGRPIRRGVRGERREVLRGREKVPS